MVKRNKGVGREEQQTSISHKETLMIGGYLLLNYYLTLFPLQ